MSRCNATIGQLFFLLAVGFSPPTLTNAIENKASAACLQIITFPEGKPLGQWKLSTKNQFALSFIHSVSVTPVIDYYQINDLSIIQTGERFEHHGAGLPSNVNEGTGWEHKNGFFWLALQRPINKLIVRTDKNYHNLLHLNQTPTAHVNQVITVNLNQWPDGALWIKPIHCQSIKTD